MQTIMRQLLYSIAAGTDTVLVTISAQTGSAPRGVGSQMLVGRRGGSAAQSAVAGWSFAPKKPPWNC